MGGMISATVLGIFFVPLFFLFVRRVFKTKPRTDAPSAAPSSAPSEAH